MTLEELGRRVRGGKFVLVGELRAADVREAGFVDTKTGQAMKSLIITYFMERQGTRGYEIVRITRRAPDGVVDPAQVPITTTKGKTYVFEIESLERKPGSLVARMAGREPEEMESCELPPGAPSGAPVAAS